LTIQIAIHLWQIIRLQVAAIDETIVRLFCHFVLIVLHTAGLLEAGEPGQNNVSQTLPLS
jgi:hypothetical protein